MILIVAPEICKTGGVQKFSWETVRACEAIAGSESVVLYSRNDSTRELRERFPQLRSASGSGVIPHHFRRFAAKTAVRGLIRKFRPSIILCTHPQLVPAATGAGVPVIGVCHGIDAWELSGRLKRHLLRADRILAVSRYTRDRIIEQLPALAPRLYVFPNTVDTKRFSWGAGEPEMREKLRVPLSAPLLLAVTRLSPSEAPKGYDDVLRALPKVLQSHPEACFVLGGRGGDLPRIEKLAEELGVASQCRFPGFVSEEELPQLYRAADLFVLPSRKEGFGIVFVEALACGTAVIAGNADGSRDALLDGELGTLVTPGDVPELAAAIQRQLVIPPSVQREAGRLRSQRIHEEFGAEKFRARLAEHLDAVAPAEVQSSP